MKRILITGASGFTGLHACHSFLRAGYEVIGVSRQSETSFPWIMEACDLLNQDQVHHVIKKYKPAYCLHLAGVNSVPVSWNQPLLTMESNLIGTLRLLEAMRFINPECRTLITGSALSGTNHPYALSKKFQQELCLAWAQFFQLPVLVAQPCNLIGPGLSSGFVSVLARKIVHQENQKKVEPIAVSHLNNAREFLDVRDAVTAYEILLNIGSAQSIYEIGSGRLSTLNEIAKKYQSLTEVKLSFFSSNQSPDKSPRLMNTKNIKELNWEPKISLSGSISDILSYYRSLKSM
jgi:nucleoside-diphosphate-sugar epimerase